MDRWSVSHAAAKAIIRFDADTRQTPGSLQRIELINSSLVMSSIMSIVVKDLFKAQTITTPTTVVDSSTAPPIVNNQSDTSQSQSTSGWFDIDHIVRSARRKGKTMYQVQWRNYAETSWVPRQHLTDTAFKIFSETRRRRKRKRN